MQWFCVVYGVYCGYKNSRYSAMVTVFFVEFIVVTATADIVQCYSVLSGVYCGYRNCR